VCKQASSCPAEGLGTEGQEDSRECDQTVHCKEEKFNATTNGAVCHVYIMQRIARAHEDAPFEDVLCKGLVIICAWPRRLKEALLNLS